LHSFIRDRHRGQQQQRQMQINHQKSKRKPQPRRRSGRDNPEPGGPRHGNAGKSARPTPQTKFSVYDGTPFDRIGSFRRDGNSFEAFDRLGRPLGVFDSEQAAIAAIDPEASK
jgi:hypothetical protein